MDTDDKTQSISPMKTAELLALASALMSLVLPGLAAVHYVSPSSINPASPYSSWTTAATNIQDAIDVTSGGDEVIVTNGIYATGGRVDNFGSSFGNLRPTGWLSLILFLCTASMGRV